MVNSFSLLPSTHYLFSVIIVLRFQNCHINEIIQNITFFLRSLAGLFKFIYFLFIFWLCWVFISLRGLSLVVASGDHSSSRCAGLSLSRPLLLQSTGSRHAGSVIVAHGPSCSMACGIFPDQGSNPCPLHWQADSQPLRHHGSPEYNLLKLAYSNPHTAFKLYPCHSLYHQYFVPFYC